MRIKKILFPLFIFILIFCLSYCFFHQYFFSQKILYQIDPDRPMIALTFDDGPHSHYTPQLLKLLNKEQVPATFFVTGQNIQRYPLLIKNMAASGHELANHTFSHPDLTTISANDIQYQIRRTELELKKIIPDYQLKYVRPPYGHTNKYVEEAITHRLVLWTLDSGDWQYPKATSICQKVLSECKDRDIIIFHDDNQQTINALQIIIPELKRKGFQFVTVSELFQYKKI